MTGSSGGTLSRADRARIADAIRSAEATTSGEIVVVVAARAGLYRSVGLALGLLAGLALPWPLILLTGWSAASIVLAQAVAVLAVLLLTLDERVRLMVVPRPIRRDRAHEAARREFLARGLTRTKRRTGVLIYVALAEHYAEIVADRGVRERVPDATWHATVAPLLAAAARGDLADGLADAVAKVGAILAAELPPDGTGNELPDRVVVID